VLIERAAEAIEGAANGKALFRGGLEHGTELNSLNPLALMGLAAGVQGPILAGTERIAGLTDESSGEGDTVRLKLPRLPRAAHARHRGAPRAQRAASRARPPVGSSRSRGPLSDHC
jgi:hypothetical protein